MFVNSIVYFLMGLILYIRAKRKKETFDYYDVRFYATIFSISLGNLILGIINLFYFSLIWSSVSVLLAVSGVIYMWIAARNYRIMKQTTERLMRDI